MNQVFQYNGSPITFQTGEATMVNATEMAKPFGKFTKDWLLNKATKEFLSTLSAVRGIPLTGLVEIKQGGNGVQGTWMHEDVALEFARWLSPQFAIWCNDRIKELLRSGMTATPQTIDSILADPDSAIRMLVALKEERTRSKELEAQKKAYQIENRRLLRIQSEQAKLLETQAPKVEYAENVLNSESTYTTTQIAKELGMSACRLNKLLHAEGVQFRQGGQWFMYQKFQERGYTKTLTYVYDKKDGRKGTMLCTVWTEAGRAFIHSLIR